MAPIGYRKEISKKSSPPVVQHTCNSVFRRFTAVFRIRMDPNIKIVSWLQILLFYKRFKETIWSQRSSWIRIRLQPDP